MTNLIKTFRSERIAEDNQQLLSNADQPLALSLSTLSSRFATICHNYFYVFTTAACLGAARLLNQHTLPGAELSLQDYENRWNQEPRLWPSLTPLSARAEFAHGQRAHLSVPSFSSHNLAPQLCALEWLVEFFDVRLYMCWLHSHLGSEGLNSCAFVLCAAFASGL